MTYMIDPCWGKRKFLNDDVKENDTKKQKKDSVEKPTKSNGCSDSVDIHSNENHVYFYSGITRDTIIQLQKETRKVIKNLDETAHNLEKIAQKLAGESSLNNLKLNYEYSPIVLHIWSPGGSIFAAFSFIDFMIQARKQNPRIKFHTIIEGGSASAATLISVTADKRYIGEYGYMLIHELSSFAFGKYSELKDDMENCDTLMERIKEIYKKHTKIPLSEMSQILKHDLYWDAEKCLGYGLVDEIIKN